IAPTREPGERLVLSGVVRNAHGLPLPGAGIRAYHSDAHGNYGYEGGVPRLHREFRSGPHGEFRIHTIIPGGSEGQPHIHFEVTTRGQTRYSLVVPLLFGASIDPTPAKTPTTWRP